MPSNLFAITSKIITLARSGRISCARKLFDEMPHRDSVAWNAMLTSYSQLGLHQEAVSLFQDMRVSNTRPDHFSLTSTLKACAGASELRNGMKLHSLVIVFGYQFSLPVCNSLIDMYGKCFRPSSASRVFEEMDVRNEVTWCSMLFAHTNSGQLGIAYELFHLIPRRVDVAWNIVIAGHAQCGAIEACLGLFKEMLESLGSPDQWTFSSLMNACAESSQVLYGRMLHAFITKSGWSGAVEAKNSILSFYSKLGSVDDATEVFKSIEKPSLVSWNSMIDAHMRRGDVNGANLAFQHTPEKNIITWTSMIIGYARNGHREQALSYFVEMMRNCFRPDDFAFGAVLYACSSLAILGPGRMVHACVMHHGFHAYAYVGNGLINMYAKCGELDGSRLAFDDILNKDLISWNTMLFGLGLHGQACQALSLYDDMVACGTTPDKVTFIGLLMTCSHAGLLKEGQIFFDSMDSLYGLTPEIDHVSCMVDMLGRGGYLVEAHELGRKYSLLQCAETSSHEPMLGACFSRGDLGIGEQLGQDLLNLEPQKDTNYVLLSNLYCASGKWKEAELVRKTMAAQGVKKTPGCSWIEVRNKMTAFVSGKYSHTYTNALYETLYVLEFEMKNARFYELKECESFKV